MKKVLYCLLGCVFIFLFNFNSVVHAETKVVEKAVAPGISASDPEVGSIILYDNYKLEFNYVRSVKNIKIWVCEKNMCDMDNPTIGSNQVYIDESKKLEYDLTEYFVVEEGKNATYIVKATAEFSVTYYSGPSIATLNHEIEIKNVDGEILFNILTEESEGAIKAVKTWVLPGLYVLFALTLVIKGVLLGIDIVNYSDQPDVRREKIHAFVYFGIGIIAVSLVTTCVGFLMGLFD